MIFAVLAFLVLTAVGEVARIRKIRQRQREMDRLEEEMRRQGYVFDARVVSYDLWRVPTAATWGCNDGRYFATIEFE